MRVDCSMKATPPAWRDPYLLLAISLPVVGLLWDHQWMFAEPGRDPSLYLGYFANAPTHVAVFADRYYSSRLSMIIPGWILHRLLPALPAHVVLHLLLFWAAIVGLFVAARLFCGRTASLLATILFVSNPAVMTALSRNMPDAFGITYYVLALAALVGGTRQNRRWLLLAAGAFAAGLVAANLFYAIYLPWIALAAWASRSPHHRMSCRETLGAWFAGTVGALVLMGAVSAVWGGHFLFLLPSVRWIAWFSGQESPFSAPLAEWIHGASWLVVPGLVALTGVATLLSKHVRGGAPGPGPLALQIQYLTFVGVMLIAQLGSHSPVLQYPYYASLLLPPAFLALAGQLSAFEDGLSGRQRALLVWFTGGVGLCGAIAISLDPYAPWPFGWWATAAAGMVALVAALRMPSPFGAGLLVAGIFVCQTLTAPKPITLGFQRYRPHRAALFEQMAAAIGAIQRLAPRAEARFWYDLDGPNGLLFDSINTAYLNCDRLVNQRFPIIADGRLCDGGVLQPGTRIAVLSVDNRAQRRAFRALRQIGLDSRVVGQERVEGPAPAFTITLLEVLGP